MPRLCHGGISCSKALIDYCLLPRLKCLQVMEPILLLGKERFAEVDIRVRVKGGGHTSQIYGE